MAQGARQNIIDTMQQLDRAGLNNGTSGNVSQRHGAGMLITPTGISCETLEPAMIVDMSLSGAWDGPARPSSEWAMHAAIYRAFPQAQAVVHAHPDYCVSLSCLRQPIPAFHYTIAAFGGDDVPCADYRPFGSSELADVTVAALAGRNACLLANHGMICYAGDLRTALTRALRLETLARQYVLARNIGTPVILNGDEMSEVLRRFKTYGQQKAQ